ncbi:MAG: ATP-binding protein [Candidatus Methanofastidiosa archaeon]|nr:ATP-binding protein [Candidatus Methanofastidiosa archaeon]
MVCDINESFDKAEKVGVIGSPSSTGQLTLDILGTAVNKKLIGNIGVFEYVQDGKAHFALGQITEILMQNVWTQDPTMRGLIRQKGRVDPITEKQDTHTATMTISSVFGKIDDEFEPSILGTVPSTGTPIKLLEDNIMNSLLHRYQNQLFYLGKAYGNSIKMPMWYKHFGDGPFGVGEAYHIGIFGKTGSGKSVLAKMIIIAYSRHPEMSIFILDPQGEYSKEFSKNKIIDEFYKNKLKRKIKIFTLNNLVLNFNQKLFQDLLIASKFFDKLSVDVNYEAHSLRFTESFITVLNGKKGTLDEEIKPWDYHKKEAFERIWSRIGEESFLKDNIAFTANSRERILNKWKELNSTEKNEMYNIWSGITKVFSYRGKNSLYLSEIFKKNLEKGSITIIDLSTEDKPEDILWNEDIEKIAMQQFLNGLINNAESCYKEGGNLNSLVIIDEAHRLAPKEISDDAIEKIKSLLKDAVRTTRKYGLGWMFISQTLSSLDKEIINQLRVYIFGFGLGWGSELRSLKELIGGAESSIRLYQLFKDPQSSLGKIKEYPFMIRGPVSPLSFSDMPLFFTALSYPNEFLNINFGEQNVDK